MLLSEGQMSDYKGAALMIDALPRPRPARRPRLRRRLVPQRPDRKRHHAVHPVKDQPQNPDPARPYSLPPAPRIENMFGKIKDWRRIHTRYDRCAHTFMSAICIAATVIFWLNQ
jgi:hypothetical protein